MARCDFCGRPAGFEVQVCALCASGGSASLEAAARPYLLLTVPGVVHTRNRSLAFELRITSHGLEVEWFDRSGNPFGEFYDDWSLSFRRITSVSWESTLAGWEMTAWRGFRVLRSLQGLDASVAPAAATLIERRLAEANDAGS